MSVIIFDTSILGNLFGFSQNKYYFIIIISKSELLVLGEECNISELVVAESCTLLNSWMQKNRADYPTPECRRIVQTTQLLVAEESCRLPKIMTAGESCRLPNSWLQKNRADCPTPGCRRIVQTTQLLVAGESCRLPNSWLQKNRADY